MIPFLIPFPSLLEDMNQWCDDFSKKILLSKAHRVYNRCVRIGKNGIAQKIKGKYRLDKYRIEDDRTMAFRIMLESIKKS